MNITLNKTSILKSEQDLAVFPLFEGDSLSSDLKKIDSLMNGAIRKKIKESGFNGEHGKILTFNTNGLITVKNIALIGLGLKKRIFSRTVLQGICKGR